MAIVLAVIERGSGIAPRYLYERLACDARDDELIAGIVSLLTLGLSKFCVSLSCEHRAIVQLHLAER